MSWPKLLGISLAFFVSWPGGRTYARALILEAVRGRTTIITASGSALRADPGYKFKVGDQIITTASAKLRLDLNQGVIILTGNSRAAVQELSTQKGGARTTLRLYRGNLWASLRRFTNPYSLFLVHGPQGTIYKVRGTQFSAFTDGKTNLMAVDQGSVQAENSQGGVFVGAGFGVAAPPGQGPNLPTRTKSIPSLEDFRVERQGAYWRIQGKLKLRSHLVGTPYFLEQPIQNATLKLGARRVNLESDRFDFRIKAAPAPRSLPLLGNETFLKGEINGHPLTEKIFPRPL
ncbi:MAG: FecR domain-containing protein [Acaryochloridaceae cyanobacterium SU_2_1]|nr:FecR domain-containing protein [Acaryochloridaceae cyanobacterium SU_2_1]